MARREQRLDQRGATGLRPGAGRRRAISSKASCTSATRQACRSSAGAGSVGQARASRARCGAGAARRRGRTSRSAPRSGPASRSAAASAAVLAVRERVAPTAAEACDEVGEQHGAIVVRAAADVPPARRGRHGVGARVAALVAVRRAARRCRSCARAAGDPTFRVDADGTIWRGIRTPAGHRDPAAALAAGRTARCTRPPGAPGADWALDSVPSMLGADDDADRLRADAPGARRRATAARPHWRVVPHRPGDGGAGARDHRAEGHRPGGARRLPAAGPPLRRARARGRAPTAALWVQPSAETVRMIPSWEWLRMHVDPARSRDRGPGRAGRAGARAHRRRCPPTRPTAGCGRCPGSGCGPAPRCGSGRTATPTR